MMTPRAASSTIFLQGSLLQASRISGTWSAQGASPSALLQSLIFGPWCACHALPAIRSCKPASAALLLLVLLLSLSPNLALGLQARLPPLSPPPNAMRAQWLTVHCLLGWDCPLVVEPWLALVLCLGPLVPWPSVSHG